MIRMTSLFITLLISLGGLTFVQAAPPKTKPLKVAVTEPKIDEGIEMLDREVLKKNFLTGLKEAGVEVISGKDVEQAYIASPKHCKKACIRQMGHRLKVRYIAGAKVKSLVPHYFKIKLWIADTISGERIAVVNQKCDICYTKALGDRMSLSASNLAAELKKQEKEPGSILITSSPEGASIYIDDKYRGKTPKKVKVKAGAHLIKVSSDNYYTDQKEKRVTSGVETKFHCVLVKKEGTPTKDIIGYSTIGAGALAIGAGIIYMASTETDNLSGQSSLDKKTPGWILIGVGGAAIIGGLTAVLWPSSKAEKETNTSRINLLPGYKGIMLHTHF